MTGIIVVRAIPNWQERHDLMMVIRLSSRSLLLKSGGTLKRKGKRKENHNLEKLFGTSCLPHFATHYIDD